MTDNRLTCGDCDDLLAAYFEDDLDTLLRASVELHASECSRCHALVRDLKGIVTEAGSLADLAPAKDLWQGIDSRIQPAVVSLSARQARMGISGRALIAAAAALVVVTSSVTYVATSRTVGAPNVTRRTAGQAGDAAVAGATSPPSQSVRADAGTTLSADVDRAGLPDAETRDPPLAGRARGRPANGQAMLAAVKPAPMSASERVLSGEIATLQQLLDEKRDHLDPVTVRVVEDNLLLIDVAVKQARAALARDPASGFLTGKLDNALNKKVELLRTAALLPSKS